MLHFSGNKFAMHRFAEDLLFHAMTWLNKPSTCLILTKDIDEDPMFSAVLEALQRKCFNIVVQNPTPIVKLHFSPND